MLVLNYEKIGDNFFVSISRDNIEESNGTSSYETACHKILVSDKFTISRATPIAVFRHLIFEE